MHFSHMRGAPWSINRAYPPASDITAKRPFRFTVRSIVASCSAHQKYCCQPDPADLALIGAAQRVEHYEISGYTTARNLAQQLRQRAIVARLSKSLAEEENADQLLDQVARSLMSVTKMPAAIEQAAIDGAE
jgi:ferritin-like metal-binding protein YciE